MMSIVLYIEYKYDNLRNRKISTDDLQLVCCSTLA